MTDWSLGFVALTALAAGLCSSLRPRAGGASPRRDDVSPEAETNLAVRIDALLPQTQCEACGFAGCRPYADAIASGSADFNRCPPGGAATIRRLAHLLGREPIPLDPTVGVSETGARAFIDEQACIGCVKCVRACPVDAILGAAGHMHSVNPQWCTGCGLCLPPCPVDCIQIVPAPAVIPNWSWPRPAGAEGARS